MSRIGKNPVAVPATVKAAVNDGVVFVEGPKGKLEQKIPFGVTVEVAENQVLVKRLSDSKNHKALHGTIRSLIANMVKGVTDGYTKELEIIGVGYRAQAQGKKLTIQVRFTHPVEVEIPDDLKITTPKPTQIVVQGTDKARVGKIAAEIRRIYPPEPYKGTGIRFVGEYVKKKQGKAITK